MGDRWGTLPLPDPVPRERSRQRRTSRIVVSLSHFPNQIVTLGQQRTCDTNSSLRKNAATALRSVMPCALSVLGNSPCGQGTV